MHSEERKNGVIETLYSRAGGNASKCSRLTGIDRKTIQKWKEEHEHCKEEEDESEAIPDTGKIKDKIIRRVYTIIESCKDPKKLMDTYEAISKYERESGQTKESLFDMIEKKLNGNE